MGKKNRRHRQHSNLPAHRSGSANPGPVAGVQRVQAFMHRSGPLPTPAEFAQYEAVLPGAAERLMRQAEIMTELGAKQQDHRFGLENRVVDGNLRSQHEGVWIGGAVAIIAILVGAFLILKGQSVGGLAAIIAALASPVAVFVVGRKYQVRQIAEKRAEEIADENQQ